MCNGGLDAGLAENTVVGYEYDDDARPSVVGANPTIRPETTIYDDVAIGDRFSTGHFTLIREFAEIGGDVLVGSKATIDGATTIGLNSSLQTGVYVPSETTIGDHGFLKPNAVLTNDPYPLPRDVNHHGPTLQDHVSFGANAPLLSSGAVGRDSFVPAGAVVTDTVPEGTLAIGVPATHEPLPESLQGGNE